MDEEKMRGQCNDRKMGVIVDLIIFKTSEKKSIQYVAFGLLALHASTGYTGGNQQFPPRPAPPQKKSPRL